MATDALSDKRLLELAAKAAGIEHPGGEHSIHNDGRLWDCNGLRWWNPLTDDGDAFRLAVKCGILNLDDALFYGDHTIDFQDDSYAATRRAIVRAAAQLTGASEEIGKSWRQTH